MEYEASGMIGEIKLNGKIGYCDAESYEVLPQSAKYLLIQETGSSGSDLGYRGAIVLPNSESRYSRIAINNLLLGEGDNVTYEVPRGLQLLNTFSGMTHYFDFTKAIWNQNVKNAINNNFEFHILPPTNGSVSFTEFYNNSLRGIVKEMYQDGDGLNMTAGGTGSSSSVNASGYCGYIDIDPTNTKTMYFVLKTGETTATASRPLVGSASRFTGTTNLDGFYISSYPSSNTKWYINGASSGVSDSHNWSVLTVVNTGESILLYINGDLAATKTVTNYTLGTKLGLAVLPLDELTSEYRFYNKDAHFKNCTFYNTVHDTTQITQVTQVLQALYNNE